MACRGVHFALDPVDEARVLEASDDEELMQVIESLETRWDRDWLVQTDKAWDAIHRTVTDGELLYDNGEYPLKLMICGGKQLFLGDGYTVSFISRHGVGEVAAQTGLMGRDWFRERCYRMLRTARDYGGVIGDEDFEYAWQYFEPLKAFFNKVGASGLSAIFTVDA